MKEEKKSDQGIWQQKLSVRLQMGYSEQRQIWFCALYLHLQSPSEPLFCVWGVFCWEELEKVGGQEWELLEMFRLYLKYSGGLKGFQENL